MADLNIDKLLAHNDEQYRAMFNFYKANPALAAIDLLNQDLPPYQRILVNGNAAHSFVINVLSRGMGKTRTMAVIAALEAMFNPKKKVGFLGPQFRVSKLAFAELEAIYNESEFFQASVKRISRQTDTWLMEFHNNAFIYAMPLAADSKVSIRGIRLHTALIDEYPHVPKEVLDAVITPMLATQLNPMANVRRLQKEKRLIKEGKLKIEDTVESAKNKVLGFSSAYFKYNHMWTTICQYREIALEQKEKTGKSDYAVYVFNYKDAPEGFIVPSVIEHAKRTTVEIIFRMEYLSEFPSDSDGFFKRSLIDSCISKVPNAYYLEMNATPEGIYFLGVDPARNHDAFSISVMKLVGNEIRLVRVISFQKTALPLVAATIRTLIKQYRITMIGMDAGGGGLAMKDLLADPLTANNQSDIILDIDDESLAARPGRKLLRMVNFSPNWISQANYDLKASMEHGRLTFPSLQYGDTFVKPDTDVADIEDISVTEFFQALREMESIVVTMTKSGVLHFDTEKQAMRKDRYTSILIAHRIVADYIKDGYKPKELAYGGFVDHNGNMIGDENANEFDWKETAIIDAIAAKKKEFLNGNTFKKFDDASLG